MCSHSESVDLRSLVESFCRFDCATGFPITLDVRNWQSKNSVYKYFPSIDNLVAHNTARTLTNKMELGKT